jgi:DNA-directed RNA polymerase specialized sigma24 family protein
MQRIYEKYRDRLLTLVMALLNDTHGAEDVVQDVFVGFVQAARKLGRNGDLKKYLVTCVANRIRNLRRAGQKREAVGLDGDEALVGAVIDDAEAVGKLYDRHYKAILAYVYHSTLDATTAEDLTSNVFLAAFEHLRRYRWRRVPFRAWLYRIATNEIRMDYRRRKCTPPAIQKQPSAESH